MSLRALLRPESVAVIGVSDDPAKLGSQVLRNLVRGGYAGRIHAVGRATALEGAPCVTDATQLAEPVDVAFIAVPAEATVHVAEQCAARGVRAIVVGAAGFAEDGEDAGVARQAALARLSRESGMRLLGPNCNGLYNPHHRFSLGFNTAHGERLAPGCIALLSHSGALFESMVRRLEALHTGLSVFVSIGNEADLDILDLMAHQIEDPATRVIALLVDALPDAERFADLASRAHASGRPVVALKLGGSFVGAEAATAHSSRMVGDGEAYRALFRRCGVACASTLEGFTTAAALLARFGMREGGLAAVSTSGAGGALLADVAARHGVAMPAYGPETQARLGEHRRFSRLVNPTDLGVFGGALPPSAIISAVAEDPAIGAIVFQTHRLPSHGARVVAAMAESQARTGKAHVLLAPGDLPAEERAVAQAAGVQVLTETDNALQGLGALLTPPPAHAELARPKLPRPAGALMGEHASLQLLAQFGVPVVQASLCEGLAPALTAAGDLGWPVAMKSAEEGLAHKSDQGLVRLNLRDADQMTRAYRAMGEPGCVIVQPMARGDLEIILGLSRAPGSGMTLLAGLGGVFAEALDATVKWSLPASRETILEGLRGSALGRVMTSSRWRGPAALADVAEALLRLQDLAIAGRDWIEAIDINPLIATDAGLLAVDALVTARCIPETAEAAA